MLAEVDLAVFPELLRREEIVDAQICEARVSFHAVFV